MSNKSNRKFMPVNQYSNNSRNFNSVQRHRTPIHSNSNTSNKRSYDDKSGNSEDQPSAKRSKLRSELPFYRSGPDLQSKQKNLANKRLQNLRRSLEEKRSFVEQQINERLNRTIGSSVSNISTNKYVSNSTIINTKTTKEVSWKERSSSSTIQSRLHVFKSSNQHKNNNSTVTTNVNTSIISSVDTFNRNVDDPMDWEQVDEATVINNIIQIRKEITYNKRLPIDDILNSNNYLTVSQNSILIVVDTNIFLSALNILVQLKNKEFQDFGRATIIIPWMVIQELDYMKESKGHLSKNARKAVSYINDQLKTMDPFFRGQTVLEASKQEISSKNPDDGILNCCLQLCSDNKNVVLLSNDINLRNKALVNRIQAYSSTSLFDSLNNLSIPNSSNANKINLDKIKLLLSNLLTHIVESEMRKAYGDDLWLKIIKSNPPFTMDEALNLMCKYWISVFSFSLQKQAKQKIEEFILFSKSYKNVDIYNQDIYNKFMEHSLTLCIYLKNGYPCYKFLIMDCLSNIQKCAE